MPASSAGILFYPYGGFDRYMTELNSYWKNVLLDAV